MVGGETHSQIEKTVHDHVFLCFSFFVYIPINDEGKVVSLKFASTDLREWEELPPTPLPFSTNICNKRECQQTNFYGLKVIPPAG